MNPRNTELSAITQVVIKYAAGCQTGNVALMRSAFHPQAMMFGSSGGQTIVAPIDALYAYIESSEPPSKTGEPHQCTITSIQLDGNVASVEMVQEACYGNDYTNYFQLVKDAGQWLTVSKAYNGIPAKKEPVAQEQLAFHAS